MNRRKVTSAILLTGLGTYIGCRPPNSTGGPATMQPEDTDPIYFAFDDLEGNRLSLMGHLRKQKVVFVNFWATWCAPCLMELPDFQKLYDNREALGIEVLTVNLGEDPETVRRFMEKNSYTFPVGLDLTERSRRVYDIVGVPVTAVYGRNDRLIGRFTGATNYENLESIIQ